MLLWSDAPGELVSLLQCADMQCVHITSAVLCSARCASAAAATRAVLQPLCHALRDLPQGVLPLEHAFEAVLWVLLRPQICWDGGELVCCDRCPCAYHPECLGLSAAELQDVRTWKCPLHYCADCGKASAQAGNMLFRWGTGNEPDRGHLMAC
jgi:hypothetical protein